MSLESLTECIDNGECKIILHKMESCIYCQEMKQKLDRLGIEYAEEEIDEETLEEFNRQTVPFLQVKRDNEEDIVFENEDIETLKEKLSRLIR